MKYCTRLGLVLLTLFVLSVGYSTRAVVAQDGDECEWKAAAELVLAQYDELMQAAPEADPVNTVATLQDMRLQLKQTALPQSAYAANAAILNMLHLTSLHYVALMVDSGDLGTLSESWLPEAKAEHDNAVQLVAPLCGVGLVIADFDTCVPPNNLGGSMGAAFTPPNKLVETYEPDDRGGAGCVVKMEYEVDEFAAFWLKLQGADLSPYTKLQFDIKADSPAPQMMKIELKRAGGSEMEMIYISEITDQWQPMVVNFEDMQTTFAAPLSSLADMEELVFVFEQDRSGSASVVYIDNIQAVP